MNAALKTVVARMASDPAFAARVQDDPGGVAAEFGLDAADMAAVSGARVDTTRRTHQRLEERLSRSALVFGGDMGGGDSGGGDSGGGDSGGGDSGGGDSGGGDSGGADSGGADSGHSGGSGGGSHHSDSGSSDDSSSDRSSDDSSGRDHSSKDESSGKGEPSRAESRSESTAPQQQAPVHQQQPAHQPATASTPGAPTQAPAAQPTPTMPTPTTPDVPQGSETGTPIPDTVPSVDHAGTGSPVAGTDPSADFFSDWLTSDDGTGDGDGSADGPPAGSHGTDPTGAPDDQGSAGQDGQDAPTSTDQPGTGDGGHGSDADGSGPGDHPVQAAHDMADSGFAGPVMAPSNVIPTPTSPLGYPNPSHDPNAAYHGGQVSDRSLGTGPDGRQLSRVTYADGSTAEVDRLTTGDGTRVENVERQDGTVVSTTIAAGSDERHVTISTAVGSDPITDRVWDGTNLAETASFPDGTAVQTTWEGGTEPKGGDTLFRVDELDTDEFATSSTVVTATPDGGAYATSWDNDTGQSITARLDVSETDNADGSVTRVYLFPDGRTEAFTFNADGSPTDHETHFGTTGTPAEPPVQGRIPAAASYHGGVTSTELGETMPDGGFVQHVSYADGTTDDVAYRLHDDGTLVGQTVHEDLSRTTTASHDGIWVSRTTELDGGVTTQTFTGDTMKETRFDPANGTGTSTQWRATGELDTGETLFRVTEATDGDAGQDIVVRATADGGAQATILNGPDARTVRLDVDEVENIDGTTTRIYGFPDGRVESFTFGAGGQPVAHESHPDGVLPFPNPYDDDPGDPSRDDLQHVLDDLLAGDGAPDGTSGQIADLLHGALEPGPDGEPATGPLADLARVLTGGHALGDGDGGGDVGGPGPDGHGLGEIGPDGHPGGDGPVVGTHTTDDGSEVTTTTQPDGSTTEVTFGPDGSSSSVTTAPDGTTTILGTSPDGTFTRTVTHADGSFTAQTDAVDGSSTVTAHDADGRTTDTTTYPDGTVTERSANASTGHQLERTTYPDGTTQADDIAPDGSMHRAVSHPDGTTQTVDTSDADGVRSTTTYPDGRTESTATDPSTGYTTVTRTAPSGFVSTDVTAPDGSTTRTSGFPGGPQTVESYDVDGNPVTPAPAPPSSGPVVANSPYDVDTSQPPPGATGPGRWVSGFAGWTWVSVGEDGAVPGGNGGPVLVPAGDGAAGEIPAEVDTGAGWGPFGERPDLGDLGTQADPDGSYRDIGLGVVQGEMTYAGGPFGALGSLGTAGATAAHDLGVDVPGAGSWGDLPENAWRNADLGGSDTAWGPTPAEGSTTGYVSAAPTDTPSSDDGGAAAQAEYVEPEDESGGFLGEVERTFA